MLTFTLKDHAATEHFGQALGHAIHTYWQSTTYLPISAIFLQGPLGSGKTTLTRALVQTLPHGMEAEVSSPSFTLCNHYATAPEIIHCDLYRCANALPDEVWDALENEDILCIVEWAQYLPTQALPEDFLDICFEMRNNERLVTVNAKGPQACLLLQQCT